MMCGWVGGSVIDSKAALVVPACYSVIISLTKHNFLTTHTTNGHKPAQMAKKHELQNCNSFETSLHGELCKFEESLSVHEHLSMFALFICYSLSFCVKHSTSHTM